MNAHNGSTSRTGERRVVGIALIAIGLLALAGSLGVMPALSTFAAAALFAAAGVAALALARRNRSDWLMAAAFPAFGIALAVLIPGDIGGAAFLFSVGAAFLALYVAERERWWALIPAGAHFTIGVLAAGATNAGGAIFFLGLSLTFAAVWRLPDRPQPWAVYPAAASLALALLVWATEGGWLLPVLLIAVGVLLMLRAQRTSKV